MHDYNDNAYSPRLTYATSSVRDEPFTASTSATRYDPLGRLVPSTPYKFPKKFQHLLVPPSLPLVPGLTNISTLTAEHPLVTSFLSRVPSVPPTFGRISGEAWWTKSLHSWTVNGVLDLTDHEGNEISLSKLQEECIFVLAAMKVFYYPKHPKHFTMWGKDWAIQTAERVHKLLLMKPCPITHAYTWMSVEQNLWMIEAEQVSAFPQFKDGKKVPGGMMLRKRKPGEISNDPLAGQHIDGVTNVRPKKRLRASGKAKKAISVAPIAETNEELLEELPLPDVVVALEQSSSGSSTAVSPADESATKETKLELLGVDSPPEPSLIAQSRPTSPSPIQPPAPKRRSARQAHKRVEPATPTSPPANLGSETLTPASDTASLVATPSTQEEPALHEVQEQEGRPIITRARSSSSSCSSSMTVVSNVSTSSADTAVDEEAAAGDSAKVAAVVEETEKEREEGVKIRASSRARKPAMKKIEADAVEEALIAEKVVIVPTKSVKKRRASGRR